MKPSTSNRPSLRTGLAIALTSAVAFGLSGPVGKSLLDAGWSSTAVALTRIGGAALILAIPTLITILRAGEAAKAWTSKIFWYGLVAIAGAQLCFFTAISFMSVSSALLIEYLAPVLLIFWTWLRTRRAPAPAVLGGAAVAVAGLMIVIGVPGTGGSAFSLVGTLWAAGAAICLTAYFAMAGASGPRPPALVLTGGGMAIGGVIVAALGLLGVMPLRATFGEVDFAGAQVSFLVPALVLCAICAVLSYGTGIAAVRLLGSRPASFISLSEVVFAFAAAWLLLAEAPTVQQAIGGVVILLGIAATNLDPQRGSQRVLTGMWWLVRTPARARRRQPTMYPTITIF